MALKMGGGEVFSCRVYPLRQTEQLIVQASWRPYRNLARRRPQSSPRGASAAPRNWCLHRSMGTGAGKRETEGE